MPRGVPGSRVSGITRVVGKDALVRHGEDLIEAALSKNPEGARRAVFLELAELVRAYGRKLNGYPEFSNELLEDSAMLGLAILRWAAKGGDIRSAMKLVDLQPNKNPIPIEHRVRMMGPEETEKEGVQIFLNAGYSPEEAERTFATMVLGAARLEETDDDDVIDAEGEE